MIGPQPAPFILDRHGRNLGIAFGQLTHNPLVVDGIHCQFLLIFIAIVIIILILIIIIILLLQPKAKQARGDYDYD